MASYVFDHIKNKVSDGSVNFEDANYKMILVSSEVFNNSETIKTKTDWSEVSAYDIQTSEYNTLGYNGPEDLSNIGSISADGNITLSADNITYLVSTIDADGAVIYTSEEGLFCAIDFGGKKSSDNGVFDLNFSNGFLKIK